MTDLDLDRAVLLLGDCRERLRALPANSIDACVTDPPYELTAATRSKPPPEGAGPFARHRVGVNGDHRPVGGFMGKEWDGTGVSFDSATWAEVLRVLKPGAHALVFGGTRTAHRLTVAIEDAGFEIRDCLAWMYGTGFPKSLTPATGMPEGQGTALKPAHEPIVLARKPIDGTVRENVAQWGTGGLQVDACRPGRRWPANVLLDVDAAAELDAQSGILKSGKATKTYEPTLESSVALGVKRRNLHPGATIGDSGGASRFFYVAKAARSERDLYCGELPQRSGGEATDRVDGSIGVDNPRAGAGRTGGARNFHPTVKPITLLRYLVRLITPPGGIVLDAFAGSGSTAIAALLEGRRFVGIEREPEYFEIAAARTRGAHERPEEAA